MKIAVVGTGYVGMSLATLLAQHSDVVAIDVVAERVELIKLSLKNDGLDNVEVMAWGGLLVDLYQQLGCCASVRGIRSESDFRYESEHALANRLLYSGYDAVLLPCRDDLSLISSSMVKEVGSYGGDISKMVPAEIIDLVKDKLLKGRT